MTSNICTVLYEHKWEKIFYHDISGGFFSDKSMAIYCSEEKRFSRIGNIHPSYKINGAYHFILDYSTFGYIQWTQTISPLDAPEENNPNIELSIIKNPYGFTHFKVLQTSTSSLSLLDGDGYLMSNYWYSVGTIFYENKIPGPYINGVSKPVSTVTLWIRSNNHCSSIRNSFSICLHNFLFALILSS